MSRPIRRWASPVIVTSHDGTTQQVSAHDFKRREDVPPEEPPAGEVPELAEVVDISQEALEAEIRTTLIQVMRNAVKLTERTAAATAGIKYLAVKERGGGEFGAGLDGGDEPED